MITHYLDLDVEAKGIHKDMRFYSTSPTLAEKTFSLGTHGLQPMSHASIGETQQLEKKFSQ